MVRLDDGSALFLKQPLEAIPLLGALREGALLRLIGEREELRGVRGLLPTMIMFDEVDNVVVSDGLVEHRTMHQIGVPPRDELLRATAHRLAALHRESSHPRFDPSVYYAINPVFDFSRVTPLGFARAPGSGFGTYLAAMQALHLPLRKLADEWRPTCLIHGDFRDDNVMVSERADAERSIMFVDWELGGWGDPLWDLGAWIGQFFYYWLESIKVVEGGDFAAWVRSATVPFPRIQTAARTILTSYAEASERPMFGADGFAARALQFAGVFLLQRVLASLESVGSIHATAFCSMHVGRTLVIQPERAIGGFA
ncbi:phosphotransferase family protein [Nannocystaceae bacterium ST9]